ncbi:MAG: hypothetical protein JWP81_2359 [Ferruginibacter sp.]|nr:hypothetical protein [Ferruginibacter sp.]
MQYWVDMKRRIRDSILKYGKSLKKLGSRISPGFDAGDVHAFRTTAKKIKALLHWQKIPKNSPGDSFVKLYHISGDLRNAQLVLINFKESRRQHDGFILWLANYIGQREQEFKEADHKKSFQKLYKKLSKLQVPGSGVKFLRTFFIHTILQLEATVLMPNPTDEELHDLRKNIKDLQYVKQWCKKNWVAGDKATRQISLLHLEKLSDLAGNYNDRRVALSLLTEYLEQEKNEQARKIALPMQKRMERQKANLKTALLKSFSSFCKQVKTFKSATNTS